MCGMDYVVFPGLRLGAGMTMRGRVGDEGPG